VIVILVPELEALLADAEQVPRRLAAIMARSRRRELDEAHYQSELLCAQAVPPAALSRQIDCPTDADGIWMRADPVGLKPDLNAVWLQTGLEWPGPETAGAEASVDLIDELQQLFRDEGLDFALPHPVRGYLRLDRDPDCSFQPPWTLAGQSMDHVLPLGPEQQRWRRLLNECQMLMYHAAQRSETAQPPGLWFWGAGRLPKRESLAPRVSHVQSSDPVLIALADWLALSHAPASSGTLADGSLVEWSANPALDATANLQALALWLAPCWRRLKRFGFNTLELASRRQVWRLAPSDAWRLWQRTATSPT
jgi:hypothetical protein